MKFLLCSLLLFPSLLLGTTHHIPTNGENAGPDIPTVGSSLFDKIYSKALPDGKAQYLIPTPIENILDPIKNIEGDFVHTMLPFSRSLQRPQDLSYDPILNPRLVFAPRSDSDSITRGKIFFGFVDAKDQLEVISYNDEAGRYEYQIITDYSTDPKVFYVNRGKCLSCHQGQAPIFSAPGWQDTSFGVMGNVLHKKLNLSGSDRDQRRESKEILFGEFESVNEVAIFDSLVRESNKISLDERIWLVGCGQDTQCRLGLLVQTLSPTAGGSKTYLDYTQRVIDASPLRKQKEFSSFLTSSDIGVRKVVAQYGSLDDAVNNPDALLDIIGHLYNLAPRDNPATKRPQTLKYKDLTRHLSSFLISDVQNLQEAIPDPNQLMALLVRLEKEKHPIFEADAINKLEIMFTLLSKTGSPLAQTYEKWITKPTPEKKLFKGQLPPVFSKLELNVFSRHCSKCHAIGLAFPPQFLIGNEQEVEGQMRVLKEKLMFKLENNLMPPTKEARDLLKNSGDYELLMRYLKNI